MEKSMREYIEQRLEEWADWYNRIDNNGLGYATKSMTHKIMEGGGIVIRGSGKYIPPCKTVLKKSKIP